MYENYFGLGRRPFSAAPLVENYVPVSAAEHARQNLIRSVGRGEGPGVVIGPAGTGKSLLANVLAKHFESQYCVVLLQSARLDSCRVLLQTILYELRLPYREMEEGEMRLSLIEFLRRNDACPNGMVLIVDEAHTLPLRLLEEIRLITNLVDQGGPRVRLVLIGGPQLEERFASPKLDSFNQRIAARCYLQPLNLEETTEYVRRQILNTGGKPEEIFAADATRAIYRATDGIPRLINQICDHALLLAFLNDRRQVTGETVDEAWSDLQQIPAPWQNPRHENQAAAVAPDADSVLEFGSLYDDHESHAIDPRHRAEEQLEVVEQGFARFGNESPDIVALQAFRAELLPASGARGGSFDEAFELAAAAALRSEIELSFHTPPTSGDVFGGGFEDEEFVHDHYALIDARTKRSVTPALVIPPEPRKPVAAAPSPVKPSPVEDVSLLFPSAASFVTCDPSPVISFQASSQVDVIDAVAPLLKLKPVDPPAAPPVMYDRDMFDPAADPVIPELLTIGREFFQGEREQHPDDRDMLVIEGDNRRETPRTRSPDRPRRGEYRQLFASLRRR